MSKGLGVRSGLATLWYAKIKKAIESKLFFKLTLALLILQAGVIAIRSGFPLAFDEGFHLGVISIHATQLSPFFSNLPDWTGKFSALMADPSYLYHYLMSFPYRIITHLTSDSFMVVLYLRFLNILMFATGVILFREVLKFTGASKLVINLVILAFVVLPLETFIAAQINYDNMLFMVVAASLLFCLKFTEELSQKKQFNFVNFSLALSFSILSTQIKYVVMPIFVATMLFMAYYIFRWLRKDRQKAYSEIKRSFASLSVKVKLALVGLVLISSGLFAYRYTSNFVRYQALTPACEKVMSTESCMQFAPWARDNAFKTSPDKPVYSGIGQEKAFIKLWVKSIGKQFTTVLDANKDGAIVEPIKQFLIGVTIILGVGIVLLIIQWRKIVKLDHATGLIILVSGFYLLAMVIRNYLDFSQNGVLLGVQSRYFLPIILLLLLVIAQAYSIALKNRPVAKLLVLIFVVIIGVQGGGIVTYLIRTDDSWNWTDNSLINASDFSGAGAQLRNLQQK